jgi:hypothetical protein
MHQDFFRIRESDLDEVLDFQSKVLVGKVCKRFEIHQDKDAIKREAKELIYEGFREVRKLIEAYNSGLHVTTFNFTKDGKPAV